MGKLGRAQFDMKKELSVEKGPEGEEVKRDGATKSVARTDSPNYALEPHFGVSNKIYCSLDGIFRR